MLDSVIVRYGYGVMEKNYKFKWYGYYECGYYDFKFFMNKLKSIGDVRIVYMEKKGGKKLFKWRKGVGWY